MPNTQFNFTNSISNYPRRARLFITNLINQIRTLRIRNEELEQLLEESQQQNRRFIHLDQERCSEFTTSGRRCRRSATHGRYCYQHA